MLSDFIYPPKIVCGLSFTPPKNASFAFYLKTLSQNCSEKNDESKKRFFWQNFNFKLQIETCLKITSLCCRICGRLVQSLRKKVSFHFCQFLSKSFQNDRSVPSKPVLFTTKLALHPSSYKFKKNYIYDVRETRILKVTKICTLHRRFFA